MRKVITILFLLAMNLCLHAQPDTGGEIKVIVSSSSSIPLHQATVSLLKPDSSVIRTGITDTSGIALFTGLPAGNYLVKVTGIDYREQFSHVISIRNESTVTTAIHLERKEELLKDVTVTGRKQFIQVLPDRTVVNVDAVITSAGATVMEVLERSPGITVDRDGNISLKGRPGAQVMIDGKLTQLSGTDLQNMLNGMSASQVETIELMDNPSAKYDAAGNAGIINIKTKKIRQRGFNGSASIALGQGQYPKNNNNLQLNYRTGDVNLFLNYSVNLSQYMLDLYALRTYYDAGGNPTSLLEQPYFTKGENLTHNLKTGIDYFINRKTTIGFAFTGTHLARESTGKSTALWMNQMRRQDSTIFTNSSSDTRLRQGGINLNARHVFDAKRELTIDADFIKYDIGTDQYFENSNPAVGNIAEVSQGEIPSSLDILSARADYSQRFGSMLWEAGWKSSRVSTDNDAKYFFRDGNDWIQDLGKSNHFLYAENIHALYSNFSGKYGKWNMQGGLRYEYTSYDANQLGNAVVKDSSFSRHYGSLFPTAFITYQADSLNSLTFRLGRRIDRPGFQKLNPFVFIVNKYTFQQGNPYYLPQYTWNIELSHTYREMLTTTISYNVINDYFSQIFLSDTVTGRIIYTEGNVGRMQNFGLTVSAQLAPAKWWSLSTEATLNHKKIEGVLWKPYTAYITQLNLSLNNQFRFKKGWSAELSGFYLTRNQNDLQEVLDPTGQLSLGVSKQVMKNRGTVRFTFRDVFYTQVMAGWTYFERVVEYFKLMRDTRVGTISFTYRFGKGAKSQSRTSGAAADEMQRVGTVN